MSYRCQPTGATLITMWKFISSCGHTVHGWISDVDTHLQAVHNPGEIYEWQMYNAATDELVEIFMWPLA